MRVAILSESDVDDVVLRVLIDAVLGQPTEVAGWPRSAGGWHHVFNAVRQVIAEVHFNTDADVLLVIVDSNHTPLTTPPDGEQWVRKIKESRLEALRRIAIDKAKLLKPRVGRPPLQLIVTATAPCIEAWLLSAEHAQITEQAWTDGLRTGIEPYSKGHLKAMLYGHDRLSSVRRRELSQAAAIKAAQNIARLEAKFPIGFGGLAKALRQAAANAATSNV